jgi:hypothetical protein
MQKASLDSNCILLHFHARFLHAKKLFAHAFAKTWRLSDGVTLQSTPTAKQQPHGRHAFSGSQAALKFNTNFSS